MTPPNPVGLVLYEARRYMGVTERPPGTNRGVEVDYWVKECGLDPALGLAWCAAFVGQVGRQALGASWPCPRTASVMALVAWAERRTTAGVWQTNPVVGDLFVLWEPGLQPPRYGHVGFVERFELGPPVVLHTVEGNTNAGGSREGYGVFARARSLLPSTRFIRWSIAVPQP